MRKLDPAKHEERRRHIIDAAGRCFARDGLRGATMADICAEAQMSPGNVYYYFDSKEAILAARAEVVLQRWLDSFAELIDADPSVLLPSHVMAMTRRSEITEGATHFDILAEAGRNPAIAELMKRHGAAVRAVFSDYLRKAQTAGRVDPALDADVAASVILGLMQSAREWLARDAAFDVDAYLAMLDRMTRDLLAPGA
jgi:AcrR family transcriptional regulator